MNRVPCDISVHECVVKSGHRFLMWFLVSIWVYVSVCLNIPFAMKAEFRKQSLVIENTFESNIHTRFNLALAEVYRE